ncbi:filamentous hemagglutinin N-terminal domain-containing protein, partial [Vreelandella olivaria]|uniref:filamentous hemagglutinin N-terminal domain-containing protein n=1 Tax=Vreelandella olivaria TaxID=390919 RepID=UPI00201E9A56
LLITPNAYAELPSGGTVVAGDAALSQHNHTLTIDQSSQNAAINWEHFSIGEHHRVHFNQPNADAAALNRVTGSEVSNIRGSLSANGRVFLVNPNGIHFSSTARVDVGALVASTLDISTEDFMAGNYTFEGGSGNAVINAGNITSVAGGHVAMIAAEIINTGSIETPQGSTLMGAGSRVTLDLGGPVKIEVEEARLATHIEQGGAIRADGGLVYLTTQAANDLTASVINHTGITQARTLATGENGHIMLMGDMQSGHVEVAGTLDASAPHGGDGGFIETSAARVSITDDVHITTRADNGTTGTWLIDPNDYTIAAEGGDITGTTLSDQLGNTDIRIESVQGANEGNGDIFVNDEVHWQSGNQLTLSADRNIEINRTIEASQGDGGKLALEIGQGSSDGVINGVHADYRISAPVNLQAGNNFSVKTGSHGSATEYTVITELGTSNSVTGQDLQGINGNLSGHYALGAHIDATATANWNNGEGFNPIGSWTS